MRIEILKYEKIFNLLIVFLINILLFVPIVRKSETEVRSSHSHVFLKEGVHREK